MYLILKVLDEDTAHQLRTLLVLNLVESKDKVQRKDTTYLQTEEGGIQAVLVVPRQRKVPWTEEGWVVDVDIMTIKAEVDEDLVAAMLGVWVAEGKITTRKDKTNMGITKIRKSTATLSSTDTNPSMKAEEGGEAG
mmetsp:Transcript_33606/g.46537  ORF Transcript_33606/g.46537 Transcript_33606/m.46537 type:complete len:136 (-) Transcript_33606:895-1302(-)